MFLGDTQGLGGLAALLGSYGGMGGAAQAAVSGMPATQTNPGMFARLGDWIKQNPEQFAMALDMAGQAFDKNNVAAGVGSGMARASLMNKAQQEAESKNANAKAQDRQWWHDFLTGALEGNMTPAGEQGPTSVNTKLAHDGTGTVTIQGNTSKLSGDVQRPTENPW